MEFSVATVKLVIIAKLYITSNTTKTYIIRDEYNYVYPYAHNSIYLPIYLATTLKSEDHKLDVTKYLLLCIKHLPPTLYFGSEKNLKILLQSLGMYTSGDNMISF